MGWLRTMWRTRKLMGRFPAPWRLQARKPLVLAGVLGMEAAVFNAHSAPMRLKALAELRVASLIGCPW